MRSLNLAREKMEEAFGMKATAVSDVIVTEPVGFTSENLFLNSALRFDFPYAGQSPVLHALSILATCKRIERELGRLTTSPSFRADGTRIYEDRCVDIDIILYGNEIIDEQLLTIPHPQAAARDFVLVPLRQIASPAAISFLMAHRR